MWKHCTTCYINYYYYYHPHHRISHFSALAGKYSPILGCSNQQDQAQQSYLQFIIIIIIIIIITNSLCICLAFVCRLVVSVLSPIDHHLAAHTLQHKKHGLIRTQIKKELNCYTLYFIPYAHIFVISSVFLLSFPTFVLLQDDDDDDNNKKQKNNNNHK